MLCPQCSWDGSATQQGHRAPRRFLRKLCYSGTILQRILKQLGAHSLDPNACKSRPVRIPAGLGCWEGTDWLWQASILCFSSVGLGGGFRAFLEGASTNWRFILGCPYTKSPAGLGSGFGISNLKRGRGCSDSVVLKPTSTSLQGIVYAVQGVVTAALPKNQGAGRYTQSRRGYWAEGLGHSSAQILAAILAPLEERWPTQRAIP